MRYVVYGILLLLLVVAAACAGGMSVIGVRKEESPDYQVIAADGAFEIRSYPSLVLASTWTTGSYEEGSNAAFRRIAGYIFGANEQREEIAMTAPVFQEKRPEGEKIAMTAPVFQERAGEAWKMSFVMPAGRTLENLPRPVDSQVVLEIAPPRLVATVRYAGLLSGKRIERKTRELREWLGGTEYAEIGAPVSAGYDPPWTLPAMRRNEVHIEVARAGPAPTR